MHQFAALALDKPDMEWTELSPNDGQYNLALLVDPFQARSFLTALLLVQHFIRRTLGRHTSSKATGVPSGIACRQRTSTRELGVLRPHVGSALREVMTNCCRVTVEICGFDERLS